MELYNYAAQLFAAHWAVDVRVEQFSSGTCFVSLEDKRIEGVCGKLMIFDAMLREDGSIETWTISSQKYTERNSVDSVKRSLRKIHRDYSELA